MSVFFERDVLGLDVGDVGVGVKCIADSDDVHLISYGVLDDGFRWCVPSVRQDRANQPIGFFGARRCPTQRTEQIVVNDDAVEIRVLKVL